MKRNPETVKESLDQIATTYSSPSDFVVALLEARFPWLADLDEDGECTENYDEPSGADVIDDLCKLYLTAKGRAAND